LIQELTEQQKAKFPEYVEKWTGVGLSTEPADRKRAENGIRQAYKNQGLKPPKNIIWTGSPYASGIFVFINRLAEGMITGENATPEIKAKVEEIDRLAKQQEVIDMTGILDWWKTISPTSYNEEKKKEIIKESVSNSGYGQHDADDMAFFSFFRNECGLITETEKYVTGIGEIVQSAGWWIPYENACIVCERYCELYRDEDGQLHNENKMALKYPDGWGLYMVHGVRIPDYIIENPNEITVEKIKDENNVEIRRIMLDKFGWERYLLETNAKIIDKSRHGVLFHSEIPDDEACVMVRLLNTTPARYGNLTKAQALEIFDGETEINDAYQVPLDSTDLYNVTVSGDIVEMTPGKYYELTGNRITDCRTVALKDWEDNGGKLHDYFIRVPPTTKTAKGAVAWMASMTPEQYEPDIQT
jgi:hypothetical protein